MPPKRKPLIRTPTSAPVIRAQQPLGGGNHQGITSSPLPIDLDVMVHPPPAESILPIDENTKITYMKKTDDGRYIPAEIVPPRQKQQQQQPSASGGTQRPRETEQSQQGQGGRERPINPKYDHPVEYAENVILKTARTQHQYDLRSPAERETANAQSRDHHDGRSSRHERREGGRPHSSNHEEGRGGSGSSSSPPVHTFPHNHGKSEEGQQSQSEQKRKRENPDLSKLYTQTHINWHNK